MKRWLNCGVTTQAAWPREKTEISYGPHTFVLLPMTKEYSASIHLDTYGMDDVLAMTLVNRFLSALSWKCDQPAINHYGWSGDPNPQEVPKYRIPYGYDPTDYFPRKVEEITDDKAKLAVALYREARSLESVPFQFLGFFKILNIFWNDQTRNGKNELKEGLRDSLPQLLDPECVERIRELHTTEGDAAEYLYKSCRCAVAHAFATPIVDPDNVADLHRLSKDLWLMRKLSAYLIERNFGLHQSIFR